MVHDHLHHCDSWIHRAGDAVTAENEVIELRAEVEHCNQLLRDAEVLFQEEKTDCEKAEAALREVLRLFGLGYSDTAEECAHAMAAAARAALAPAEEGPTRDEWEAAERRIAAEEGKP